VTRSMRWPPKQGPLRGWPAPSPFRRGFRRSGRRRRPCRSAGSRILRDPFGACASTARRGSLFASPWALLRRPAKARQAHQITTPTNPTAMPLCARRVVGGAPRPRGGGSATSEPWMASARLGAGQTRVRGERPAVTRGRRDSAIPSTADEISPRRHRRTAPSAAHR
jgi:hypothetical protein